MSNKIAQGERPLVSVIMPAYNASATIAEAIESVLAQSVASTELIVVDDGSADDTLRVLATYGEKIRVLQQSHGGLAAARNAGFAAAHGEFIALMDADDICDSNRLAVQLDVLKQFPDAAFCCSDFSAFNAKGEVAASYAARYYDALKAGEQALARFFGTPHALDTSVRRVNVFVGDVYRELAFGNFAHPPTLMCPRSTMERAGPFTAPFSFHGDWHWIVRASRLGRVAYINEPLLRYRLSATQISSSARRDVRALAVIDVAESIWQNDRETFVADTQRKRALIAQCRLEAADALSGREKWRALSQVWRAATGGAGLTRDVCRIFAKCLMPAFVMRAFRAFKAYRMQSRHAA